MRLGTYYRAKILKHFQIEATGESVLDVGAYDGYWLSTQKAENKYALDLEVNKLYKNIHYIEASALKIPFESNYFNQVFAFDVLEHIEEGKEEKFLNELIRVCKENGEIILSMPSKSIKMFPGFMTDYISRKWGHHKYNGYSKKELDKFLSEYDNISYQILENNAPFLRFFYLPIRILWSFVPNIMKKVLETIAVKDYGLKKGNNGFYIVKIEKENS